MPLRIYLTSRVLLEESGTVLLDERRLMGRQGRLVFAYLVGEHLRAVSRDELAEELWLGTLPPSWERSLSALISKLPARPSTGRKVRYEEANHKRLGDGHK